MGGGGVQMAPGRSELTPARRIGIYGAAILAGNALYFLVLAPQLPASWQHQPFVLDRGLLLDFGLCLAAYGLIRLWAGKV